MKHIARVLLLLAVVIGALPRLAAAQSDATTLQSPTGEQQAMLRLVQDAEDKLVDLAGATPQSKMSWRPGKGVRSLGEVFLHVAQANFFFPTLVGVPLPAGIEMKGFEQSTSDRAKIVELLKSSFAHARTTIAGLTPADLDKPIKLFDHEGSGREAMLIMVTHEHEHLGQAIAYARMNRIVPPWTAREQAAAAAAKKAKDEKAEDKK
jgi:uncharacterized damage-inducible protein DinB